MSGMSIALLSGVLMSVQGVFNTEVTRQTSLWVSSAFVQFTALLACLAAWIFTDWTCRAKVYAAFRSGGSVDYDHGCKIDGSTRPGACGNADRARTAGGSLPDRAYGLVRCGKAAVSVAARDRTRDHGGRSSSF